MAWFFSFFPHATRVLPFLPPAPHYLSRPFPMGGLLCNPAPVCNARTVVPGWARLCPALVILQGSRGRRGEERSRQVACGGDCWEVEYWAVIGGLRSVESD